MNQPHKWENPGPNARKCQRCGAPRFARIAVPLFPESGILLGDDAHYTLVCFECAEYLLNDPPPTPPEKVTKP